MWTTELRPQMLSPRFDPCGTRHLRICAPAHGKGPCRCSQGRCPAACLRGPASGQSLCAHKRRSPGRRTRSCQPPLCIVLACSVAWCQLPRLVAPVWNADWQSAGTRASDQLGVPGEPQERACPEGWGAWGGQTSMCATCHRPSRGPSTAQTPHHRGPSAARVPLRSSSSHNTWGAGALG